MGDDNPDGGEDKPTPVFPSGRDVYSWETIGAGFAAGVKRSGILEAMNEQQKGSIANLLCRMIAAVIEVSAPAAAKLNALVAKSNDEAGGAMLELATTGINALFGTHVSPASLGTPGHHLDGEEAGQQIGHAAITAIRERLEAPGETSAGVGQRNAEAMFNAALKEGVEEYTEELLFSLIHHWVADIPNLKAIMGSRLGVSRFSRRVLGPLFSVMVTEPFTRELNATYLPARLTASQAVRLFAKGLIPRERLVSVLRDEGYAETYAADLVGLESHGVDVGLIKQLYRSGVWDDGQARIELLNEGYLPDAVDTVLLAWRNDDAPALLAEGVRAARDLYVAGQASEGTARGAMRDFGASDREIDLALAVDALRVARETDLSLAQWHEAFVQGDVPLGDFRAFLERKRYSSDAQLALERKAIRDRIEQEQRDHDQAAKDDATKTRRPALATMEGAYVAGDVSADELRAYFAELGFDARGVALQLAAADRKKAATIAAAAVAVAKEKAATLRRVDVGTYRDAYVRQLVSRGQLAERLGAAGLVAADAEVYLELADELREERAAAAAKAAKGPAPAPARELSLAAAESAFVDGVWTEAQLAAYLDEQRFAPAAASVLLELANQARTAASERATRDAARAAAKSGPEPGLGALTKAYVAGILDRDQLAGELEARGFDPPDVELLLELADLAAGDAAAKEAAAAAKLEAAGGAGPEPAA